MRTSGDPRRILRLAMLGAALAGAAHAQTITEYPIPSPSNFPGGSITSGPDGNLWFTEGPAGAIGRITTDGVVTEFPLPSAGYVPGIIVAGPDGNLWFTEQLISSVAGKIGRIGTGGDITEFAAPEGYPGSIAVGPDGNLWFVELNGTIAKITPSGVLTVVSPAGAVDAGNSIAAGPDGNLWFTGTLSNTIGRITPGGVISTFPVPTEHVGPNQIAAGPDGNLWFTEDGGGIGRISPAGVVTEFQPPTANNVTNGIAAGPDGSVWFTESGGPGGGTSGGRVGRITPSGEITEIELLTPNSQPAGITTGPDGKLWVGEPGVRKIARIDPNGPCSTHGTSLCLRGGRFQVRAHWEVPSKGLSGDGTAVALSSDSGYFWFFDAGNVELIVKVLSACSSDHPHFWVFAGGLTNVAVTLTVTDSQTLETKTYTNPAGAAFPPVQDTSAFSTCP